MTIKQASLPPGPGTYQHPRSKYDWVQKLARHLPPVDQKLYSVNEAAAQIGIGRTHLYQLLKQGKIGSVTIGSKRLIPATEIAGYLGSLPLTYSITKSD